MSTEKEVPGGNTAEPQIDEETEARADTRASDEQVEPKTSKTDAPTSDEQVEPKASKPDGRGRSPSSLPTPLDTFAVVETSWGYPSFARDFPRNAQLDELVAAFARGDYLTVRQGAGKLAASATDERVKRAARTLRERVEPDPTSKLLFLLAAGLLAFLTFWWVTHDGPDGGKQPTPRAPKPTATTQHVE